MTYSALSGVRMWLSALNLGVFDHLLQRLGIGNAEFVGKEDIGNDAGEFEITPGAAGDVIHESTGRRARR